MKSARETKLFRPGEFMHELVAQYLITGRIKFNTEAPRALGKRMAWGNATYDTYSRANKDFEKRDIANAIEDMADQYEWMIQEILDQAIGKIYVM